MNPPINLKKTEQFLKKIMLPIAIIYPLTAIPQMFNIWYYKNVTGVSFLSWVAFALLSIPLLLYSIIKKDKYFILMYSLWCIMYMGILTGIIIYR